jgi:hypothetical protein
MVPAALDHLDDVGEPEALRRKSSVSKRGSSLASRPTPFTVRAMDPKAAKSVLFDRIDTPARLLASRPDTAKCLAASGCSAAHASSAAKDETSSLSAHRMGWGQESLRSHSPVRVRLKGAI